MDAVNQVLNCKKINGAYATAAAAEFIRDSKGRVTHIKVFLFDTTYNKNGSRLTEHSADLSMQSFKDLDFIVTPDLTHNVFVDQPGLMPDGGVFALSKPVSDYIAASANFSVGKIIEVQKNFIPVGNANNGNSGTIPAYYGLVKLKDDKFIDFITGLANSHQSIKDAKLLVSSFFVGMPTVTALAASEPNTKVTYDGPVTGIHVALVKSSAYNDARSLITGLCSGSDHMCSQMLAAASSDNDDKDQDNELITNFNKTLLGFAKTLYSSTDSDNTSKMTEESKDNKVEDKAPIKTEEKKETKTEEKKETETVAITKAQYEELTKKIEELSKANKAETKTEVNNNKENDEVKTLKAEVEQLKREKSINEYTDKIKSLQGMDPKLAKKYATIIIDKKFSTEEAEEFIKSLVPMLKASANSSNETKERKTDNAIKFSLASASNYNDLDTDNKKQINRLVNLAAIDLLNSVTKH